MDSRRDMKTFKTVFVAMAIVLLGVSLGIGAETGKPSFDIPSLIKLNISEIKKELGKLTKEVTSKTVKMKLDVWTAEWKRDLVTLQVDYYPSGKIKSVFIFDSKGSSLTKEQLLSQGNLDEKSQNYRINIVKGPFGKGLASIEVIPIPKKN
jgi:hypothetical protein